MKKNNEITYPRFLDNKPCGKDLFVGGAHDKTAKQIATLIKNTNAKIIGIDGGWGSGKSNLVHLVEKELKNDPFHFFVYNAWGFQNDFQRRSILENLTTYLIDKKRILNPKKWNGKLLQLLSRKRSINSKIVKELSAISKIGTGLAILSPLFLAISNYITEKFKPYYWLAILITSIIILIIMQIKNMRKYGQKITISSFLKELYFSYLDYDKDSDKIEQTIKYETLYDEEPSSRDFRNWMNDISKDLENNKLVIVFDNMDRLPNNKVQELWSAIHSFFAEEKYNNIYVIVPFDRDHIKSAFKSEDLISDSNKSICFGNDFINKTFDVVYRVSPPVLSDWKTYFADKWKDAFNSNVSSKITQIYDILSKVITPRGIIAFINEFVSIRQISEASIPDEYIALFILGKDKISSNPQDEILNPTYLGAMDFIYKDDEDLPKYISSLYYQLPTNKSLDIIYTENLKKALENNDFEQIKKIKSNPNVFYSVLENAITNISNISNTVLALNNCLTSERPDSAQLAWNCVYKREQVQEIKHTLQDYQKILIQHIEEKEEYLKKLVESFNNLTSIDVVSYYNSIKQLSEIKGINPFKYLKEKEVNAESFINFVDQAKEYFKKYKIVCKQENIDEYLTGLNIDQLANLNVIPYIKDEYDLTAYKVQLESLFDLNTNNKYNIQIIINRLKEIERPIKKVLSDERINTFFNAIKSDNEFYYDLICMRIARLDKFSSYNSSFTTVLNSTDETILEKIAQNIEYYIDYGNILLNIDKMKDYPLYKEVAKRLTEGNDGKSQLNVVDVLKKYDIIKDYLEIDSAILLERLNGWEQNAKKNITISNISSIPIEFFADIISLNNGIAIHSKTIAIEFLEAKAKEEWKQSILNNNHDYRLLLTIKINPQNCFDAFKELLLERVEHDNKLSKESINDLINLFESQGRIMLSTFNDVRDRFCDKGCSMTVSLFNLLGESLLKYAKLEDKQSALRTIFKISILDKKENIQLILKYRDKMIKIVEVAKEENKDFKDKIKSLVSKEYKDDKEFESFANAIGIESVQIDINNEE